MPNLKGGRGVAKKGEGEGGVIFIEMGCKGSSSETTRDELVRGGGKLKGGPSQILKTHLSRVRKMGEYAG